MTDPSPAGSPAIERSLIIPVYRNESNLPALFDVLVQLNHRLGPGFEVVFVVDGSPDASGAILADALPQLPYKARIAFHSRNFGSFAAVRTGLELAEGRHMAGMAADLQEPPELIVELFDVLARGETDIAFGRRRSRSDPAASALTSNAYWWLYRKLVPQDIPKGGVDVFACTAQVRDVLISIAEPNSSLVAQLFWIGFRRAFVDYDRQPRQSGKSAWSFSRRMRYMLDSIFSFSDAPILILLWIGILGCCISLLLGVVTLIARLAGFIMMPGYSSLLIAILFFGSAILAAQGIVGCYVWRAFENTKHRPLRIVSHVLTSAGPQAARGQRADRDE